MSWACTNCGEINNNDSLSICSCGHLENKIIIRTKSNIPKQSTSSKNKIPNCKLYKIAGITIASIFGSVLAGGFLLSRNFKYLGKANEAKKALIYSVIAFFTICSIGYQIPDDWQNLNSFFFFLQFAVLLAIAKKSQEVDINNHSNKGGRLHSNWTAFGISLIFLTFQVITLITILHFSSPEPKLEGECVTGNCINGSGTLIIKNGSKYEGNFKEGQMQGNGTIVFASGDIYEGEWENSQFKGKGVYTKSDGGQYIGDFIADKFNGHGTYIFPDGRKYIGDWKAGKINGKGTYTFPDGGQHIGKWKNDLPHGYGVESKNGTEISRGYWSKGKFIVSKDSGK